ncbi:MAG: FeoA family protein [Gemmatimonadales bacterium]
MRPGNLGLTLNDLKPGERARVRDCRGAGPVHQRLCEMGFVAGATVRLVRWAPFGDPLQVELHQSQLSLRRSEAAMIEVERLGSR